MLNITLTQEIVRELLDYDSKTGKIYHKTRNVNWFEEKSQTREWNCKRWNSAFAGKEAFKANRAKGYKAGKLLNSSYLAHRIIWLWYYGEWPKEQIDHINGNPSDNRIVNLRLVNNSENQKNVKLSKRNKTGVIGVHYNKKESSWAVYIGENSKNYWLGNHVCFGKAVKIRKEAEVEYGYHKNHGRIT